MAHADYDCCAVCDHKIRYNSWDPETKNELCPSCAVDVTAIAGRRVVTKDDLVAWIKLATWEEIERAPFSACWYANEVDDALAVRKAEAATASLPLRTVTCIYCRQLIEKKLNGIWAHSWSGLNSCSSDGVLRAKP